MSASRHGPASRLLASISSMEYVEGETLRKRLTDGPLKISGDRFIGQLAE